LAPPGGHDRGRWDFNLVVIGAGSAGLVAAYVGAALKARVALVERDRMGGDCLNTGCVPSKALIRAARLLTDVRRSREFGIRTGDVQVDFAAVMERVQRAVGAIEPHDSVARFTQLGVACLEGHAAIVSPHQVEVRSRQGAQILRTRAIVVATGSSPVVPALPGLDDVARCTSDTVWSLRELPRRLLVLGGGPVGCELAQCFARLGSRVTLLEQAPRLLMREDAEFGAMVADALAADGVDVRTGWQAQRCVTRDGASSLVAEHGGQSDTIAFDLVLCAIGRKPRTDDAGFEALGMRTTRAGTLETDAYLRTGSPTAYACGDVVGPHLFTHAAAQQAWYASVNALFGPAFRLRAEVAPMPWATFTDPEIARVGASEAEARAANVPYQVTTFPLAELDRAVIDGEPHGLIKVLTSPRNGTLLGATVAGPHAGDLIAEFALAMKHGIGLDGILHTIHPYPTLAEASRQVAAKWKEARLAPWLLALLARYHARRLR
jgi:pyruvate/2-oxoglutarate dehydrogenase complex dihydrolipoamide dehydrogenase (E3) component